MPLSFQMTLIERVENLGTTVVKSKAQIQHKSSPPPNHSLTSHAAHPSASARAERARTRPSVRSGVPPTDSLGGEDLRLVRVGKCSGEHADARDEA